MVKKKATLVWSLIATGDNGWRFYFGRKGGIPIYSPRLFVKEIALNWVNAEIEQAKNQFGDEYEVLVERQDIQ